MAVAVLGIGCAGASSNVPPSPNPVRPARRPPSEAVETTQPVAAAAEVVATDPAIAVATVTGPGVIAGVVLGPDGAPEAGAEVHLGGDRPLRHASVQQFVAADAEGRFRFEVSAGDARLGLWARARIGTGSPLAAVADVTGCGPDGCPSFTLRLAPATTLHVAVRRPRGVGGSPAERIADTYSVRVHGAGGTLRFRTAAGGGAGLALSGVPAGEYVVQVDTWCAIGQPPCAGAIARGRIEDREARVTLEVRRVVALEGTAVDPATGQPIAGAPVFCDEGPCAWDPSGGWPAITTGPDGRYRIPAIAPGGHELRFGDAARVRVDAR